MGKSSCFRVFQGTITFNTSWLVFNTKNVSWTLNVSFTNSLHCNFAVQVLVLFRYTRNIYIGKCDYTPVAIKFFKGPTIDNCCNNEQHWYSAGGAELSGVYARLFGTMGHYWWLRCISGLVRWKRKRTLRRVSPTNNRTRAILSLPSGMTPPPPPLRGLTALIASTACAPSVIPLLRTRNSRAWGTYPRLFEFPFFLNLVAFRSFSSRLRMFLFPDEMWMRVSYKIRGRIQFPVLDSLVWNLREFRNFHNSSILIWTTKILMQKKCLFELGIINAQFDCSREHKSQTYHLKLESIPFNYF